MSISQQLRAGTSVDHAFSRRLESAQWLPSHDVIDRLAREHPETGAERQMVAGGWMMYAGAQSALHHVIGMGLQGPVSSQEFDSVEQFFRSRESVCEVVVSPYADMSLLGHLAGRGYRVAEWNSVLFRQLLPSSQFSADAVNDVEVRAVQPNEAVIWSELVACGFSDVAGASPDFFAPFAAAGSSICFLAYVDGKLAGGAGGSVFPGEDIAALYGSATLPEFRNRGVQTALIRARLRAAARSGCSLAVTNTHPGSVSQRNCERNGFQLAYTKIIMERTL